MRLFFRDLYRPALKRLVQRTSIATLAILCAHSLSAQGTLALTSATAPVGGSATLNLNLTAAGGGAPAGLQWTLTYPAASLASVSAAAGASATAAGKSLHCTSNPGSYVCVLNGVNTTVMQNGVVAAVSVTLAAGVSTATINVTNTLGTDPGGNPLVINGVAGSILPASVFVLTSSVSIGSSANPSSLGQAVTFTAMVSTGGGPPGSPAPTGTVQFLDGSTPLGSAAVSGGQAAFTTSNLRGGNHLIVGQYSGDSTWPSSQGTYGQTVNALVTITVTASPVAPVSGQAVTLTANVSATVPPGFPAPTGQVTFALPGPSPFSPLAPLGSAALASGTASIGVSALPAGTVIVLALYSGDATWPSSIGTINLTILPASSSAAVSLAVVAGQLVLSAVVAPVASGVGIPTGTVQFVDTSNNNTPVASASLSGGKASATVAASAWSTVLGRPIAAAYSGDANFTPSLSATLPAVVNDAANLSATFAGDEIVSLFEIAGLNGDASAAMPLGTSLGGVTVTVTDSAGTSSPALLLGVFASTGQINFVVPSGLASGLATVAITLPGGGALSTVIDLAGSAPGIFTANGNGQGPFSGQVIYVSASGAQTVASSAVLNAGSNTYAPNPINVSTPGTQVYLVLYGTGLRHAGSVTATVNGAGVPVVYYGAQGGYDGLDQINLGPLPTSLAGAGVVNLVITADGQAANTVTLAFQ